MQVRDGILNQNYMMGWNGVRGVTQGDNRRLGTFSAEGPGIDSLNRAAHNVQ